MPETNLLDSPKLVDQPKLVDRANPGESQVPLSGAVARLYWMLVGNAVLYLSAIAITEQERERAWTADAAFCGAVASLVLVRYVDIVWLGGATASGEPASLSDWYRYVGWLFVLSLAVWITAHAVAQVGF